MPYVGYEFLEGVQMEQFLYRMLLGGLIVAMIPIIGRQFGPKVGGMIMLIPVITVLSLYFTGRNLGTPAITAGAIGGLWGLIPLAAFLATLAYASHTLPPMLAFGISMAVWMTAVAAFVIPDLRMLIVGACTIIGCALLAFVRKESTHLASIAIFGVSWSAVGIALTWNAPLSIVVSLSVLAAVSGLIGFVASMTTPITRPSQYAN